MIFNGWIISACVSWGSKVKWMSFRFFLFLFRSWENSSGCVILSSVHPEVRLHLFLIVCSQYKEIFVNHLRWFTIYISSTYVILPHSNRSYWCMCWGLFPATLWSTFDALVNIRSNGAACTVCVFMVMKEHVIRCHSVSNWCVFLYSFWTTMELCGTEEGGMSAYL